MPSSLDLEEAAVLLTAAAERCLTALAPARAVLAEGVLVGGALTASVTGELEGIESILRQVDLELRALAEQCRQRAAIGADPLVT